MKLKKQFEDFYSEIKIDDEVEDLIEKREILEEDIKNRLPAEMQNHNIKLLKSDIRLFDQGSYKLNTTITNTKGSIDRDVAVLLPLDISEHTDTRKIKGFIRDALNQNNRTVIIKEPCLTVSYLEKEEEWLHIDLPIYATHQNECYLARGKEFSTAGNFGWEMADPEGLNTWQLDAINGNQQIRRIIRYLKKWKQEKYCDSTLDHEIPPSIGLTLLAIDCFVGCSTQDGDDDLTAIKDTVQKIIGRFTLRYNSEGQLIRADITYNLPVKPYSDVFEKMKSCSDTYGVKFYTRLSRALQNLIDACNESSEFDAGTSVQKVFGTDFKAPPKQAENASTSSKKEHSFG